jgi:hypothetical protein
MARAHVFMGAGYYPMSGLGDYAKSFYGDYAVDEAMAYVQETFWGTDKRHDWYSVIVDTGDGLIEHDYRYRPYDHEDF